MRSNHIEREMVHVIYMRWKIQSTLFLNFDRVCSQMRHMHKGLKLADRRWIFITYTK